MQGRPIKLTNSFVKAAEEVLLAGESNYNAIIHTDEDLVQLINQKLPEGQQISDRTFKRWKARASDDEEEDTADGILETTFVPLLKKAKIIQKQHLFESLLDSVTGWQRYAWILERKYREWNIRHSEEFQDDKPQIKAIVMEVTCSERCKECTRLKKEEGESESITSLTP